MKNVVLVVGSVDQKTASGFIKEFELNKGKVDHIIFLYAQNDLKYRIKKILGGLKRFKPSRLRKVIINLIAFLFDKIPFDEVFKVWNNQGENSWDLLSKGINIEHYAKENGIPYSHTLRLESSIVKKHIKNDEALFLMYAGGFISEELLNLKGAEFLNAHMGEMPTFRGMNVIEWAVLENKQPRVSVMTMNKAVDGGDVIYVKDIDTKGVQSIVELRRRGYEYCYKAMAEGVALYRTNPELRKKQPDGAKYYYRMHNVIREELENRLKSNSI